MATTDITTDSLIQWRIVMFIEMGFTEDDAERLATARDDDGRYIETHRVRKMLRAGCSLELALRIV